MTSYTKVLKRLENFINEKTFLENTSYLIKYNNGYEDTILVEKNKNPYNELLAFLYYYFYNVMYDKVIFRKNKIIIHNKDDKYYLYIVEK